MSQMEVVVLSYVYRKAAVTWKQVRQEFDHDGCVALDQLAQRRYVTLYNDLFAVTRAGAAALRQEGVR